VAFNEGKTLFVAGRYGEAADALGRARRVEPGWRQLVRYAALEAGVRMAPRLLHRAYDLLRPPVRSALA
jgi:hypothetical protein